jgi:predicted transcriptional regulator
VTDVTATSVQAAGRLLAGRRLAVAHGLPWPSEDEILAATNASREQAEEIADAFIAAVSALEANIAHKRRAAALAREMLRFVMRHPDCVQSGVHVRYSARYRRFVLELWKRYADLTVSEFAKTLALPLGTLERWMRGARPAVNAGAARNFDESSPAALRAAPV